MPNIAFSALEEYAKVYDPPVPAKRCLPDWYTKQTLYADNIKGFNPDGYVNHTVRACMPAFDAMTAGYVICLPCDIFINTKNDDVYFHWTTTNMKHIDVHEPKQYNSFIYDKSIYSNYICKLNTGWGVCLPDGYSLLSQAPCWVEDTPFKALSGVIDADKYNLPLNFPFLIKKDFEGIVPMGTPVCQIIPFRREKWSHSIELSQDYQEAGMNSLRRKIGHGYKKMFRSVKEWN